MKISHEKIPLYGTSVTSKDYMTLVNRKRRMMIVETCSKVYRMKSRFQGGLILYEENRDAAAKFLLNAR